MIERTKKEPKPKEMTEIVVGEGQVVLGPGGKSYAAGESVEVPSVLLEKNPNLEAMEAVKPEDVPADEMPLDGGDDVVVTPRSAKKTKYRR